MIVPWRRSAAVPRPIGWEDCYVDYCCHTIDLREGIITEGISTWDIISAVAQICGCPKINQLELSLPL